MPNGLSLMPPTVLDMLLAEARTIEFTLSCEEI